LTFPEILATKNRFLFLLVFFFLFHVGWGYVFVGDTYGTYKEQAATVRTQECDRDQCSKRLRPLRATNVYGLRQVASLAQAAP
jgi:hypothetical protein